MSRKRIAAVVGLAAGLVVTDAALAFDTGSRYFSINGRLRQGTSLLYDTRSDDDFEQGFSQFIAEVDASYRPNRNWTFIANFWLRGDWFPSQDRVQSYSGLQDYTDLAGLMTRRFKFNLNDHGVFGGRINNGVAPPFFNGVPASADRPITGATGNELRLFNDFDEVVRELSVKYRDSKNRFTVKLGKFQRGWGQSDGLRLLDILHAQDLRERFAFRDSDELRIPAWMVSADFNFDRMGIGGPFEKLGMHRPVLEVDFIPEVHHSLFTINGGTPGVDASSGGVFGLPDPLLAVLGQNGRPVGIPFFSRQLRDRTPKETSFENAEWGLRLKFQTLGGTATLNAFYGWQDLPVTTSTGATAFIGSRVPGAPGVIPGVPNGTVVVPIDLATTVQVVHGKGGIRQFLEALPGANVPGLAPSLPFATLAGILAGPGGPLFGVGPGGLAAAAAGLLAAPAPLPAYGYTPTVATALLGGFPLANGGFIPAPVICEDLLAQGVAVADPLAGGTDLAGNPIPAGGRPTAPCSFTANFDLDYRHRQKVLGFSFTRDMTEFKFGPKRTSPVLRTEFSWEFDKAFNRARIPNPLGPQPGDLPRLLAGTNVLLTLDPSQQNTESDVGSLMIGVDYPLWLPFLKKQRKSIFTSFQFFEIYTVDAGEGLLQQSPYSFATVPSMHEFVTFLWNWPVWNEKLVLEGLLISDFDNDGVVYRQRIDYQGFGNKWRPRIEWMHFSGDAETAPAGVFADSDFLEFSLTYQF